MNPHRQAAMVSVYYHAYRGEQVEAAARTAALPEGFRPLLLADATSILLADASPAALSRRRRAAAKLVGAGLLADPAAAPSVESLLHSFGVNPADVPGGLERVMLERWVYEQIRMPDCDRSAPVLEELVFDPQSLTTRATSSIWVGRPFAELRQVLDPQRWWSCSDFFEKSYVAAREGAEFPVDENHDARRASDPPDVGEGWTDPLPIFEHFVVRWARTVELSWFRNILEVSYVVDANRIVMHFNLCRPIRSYAWPFGELDGGLNVDCGGLGAVAEGHGYRVRVTKTVRFSDRTPQDADWLDLGHYLNYLAPFALAAWNDEIEEAVCCSLLQIPRLPPEPPHRTIEAPAGSDVVQCMERYVDLWTQLCKDEVRHCGGMAEKTVSGSYQPSAWFADASKAWGLWWKCMEQAARIPWQHAARPSDTSPPLLTFVVDAETDATEPCEIVPPVELPRPAPVRCQLRQLGSDVCYSDKLRITRTPKGVSLGLCGLRTIQPGHYTGVVYLDLPGTTRPLACIALDRLA